MIDEKRLIEDTEDDVKNILTQMFYEVPSEFIDYFLKEMKELVNDQPKVGEWIPCSERLPEEEHSMYWTTHEDGSVVQHGWSERHGFIYNWELGEKRARMGTVIAWMPMFKPEPYKDGENI